MVKVTSAASSDTFPDVLVQRLTVLTGGLLKKGFVLPTKYFAGHVDSSEGRAEAQKVEFVQLKKGEQWLIHAVCGPMDRQRGLKRTKMVDDLITAALAAAEEASSEAVDEAAVAVAPPPKDPMADFSYGDDGSPPRGAGDSDETPKKQTRRRSANMAVRVEMPDKCREKYPKSTGVRQVVCYVEDSTRRGARKVWMSVDDVPWLVRLLHDQFCLGGVSLLPEQCGGDDAQTPAMAGGEESAAAELAISWDFAASAWVAAGRQLKPEEVWTQLRGALLQVRPGVDAAAWEALSYAEKKELAYKSLRHWLESDDGEAE